MEERSVESPAMSPANRLGTGLLCLESQRLFAVFRIVFGLAFLADGILKWFLFAQGNMQSTIDGMVISSSVITANWVLFGVAIGLGETLGGIFLIVGIFQKPAAAWSAAIMFSIWITGGFGGWYSPTLGWMPVGQTDLGGDLMLALIYLLLFFVPASDYSLSEYLKLPDRLTTRGTFRYNVLGVLFR